MSGPDLFSNEEKKKNTDFTIEFSLLYGGHFHNNEANEKVGFSCQ